MNKHGIEIEKDFSVPHVVLISKQKCKYGGDIFLSEMLGSAVLDSGTSSTVCETKWYECFLETFTDAQKKRIVKIKGLRTFKFGDGNKLNSLYKVILPYDIADIEVSIITDVVNSDIPLLLSKDAMKRAGTCLNLEDDTVTMLKKKIPSNCISSKPIVGNFNMVSVTSESNSGIFKKSLYKPAPKERIKAKSTNRKPLAQSQLFDLNNPRSANICKNGMKSLLTLECNFLSPDVQRWETICTLGKASISCRQYDAEVDDKLSETMNEKENWN